MPVYASQEMGRVDSTRVIDPAQNKTYFLSNSNEDLIGLCERKMSKMPHFQFNVINNRFYISKNDTKPVKNE